MNRLDELTRARIARQLTRPSTKARYASLCRMTGDLGEKDVDSIRREDVQDCLAAAQAGGVAPATLRKLLGLIRGTLHDHGNAAADGLRVSVPSYVMDVHSAADTEKLRRELLPCVQFGGTALGLLILIGTGIRKGELLGLIDEDWDSELKRLRIARGEDGSPTKNGKVRYVDVPEWLASLLDEWGPIVKTNATALRRTLDVACERAGVRRLKVHGLRHSRITQLLLGGAPVLYVSDQAGHASPSFTLQVYGHLCAATQEQRREWANL